MSPDPHPHALADVLARGAHTKLVRPGIYSERLPAFVVVGEVVNWAFEMGGPNALIRRGWTRNSLTPDDLVTFEGSLARDGSRLVNARSLVMTESGRRMFAGSSEGDEPPASTPQ